MKNKLMVGMVVLLLVGALLLAACSTTEPAGTTPEAEQAGSAFAEETVPEIAQADQTVQELDTSDLDSVDSDLDSLVLP